MESDEKTDSRTRCTREGAARSYKKMARLGKTCNLKPAAWDRRIIGPTRMERMARRSSGLKQARMLAESHRDK